MAAPVTSMVEPVLGTRLALRLTAADDHKLALAEDAVLAECDRLEDLLSAYRPDSAWNQWRDGRVAAPAVEVAALLRLAAEWFERSDGAFNPQAGVLRARWLRAAAEGQEPLPDELTELARGIAGLPYTVAVDGTVERHGDCTHLDLHAIAKGWVADRAGARRGRGDGERRSPPPACRRHLAQPCAGSAHRTAGGRHDLGDGHRPGRDHRRCGGHRRRRAAER